MALDNPIAFGVIDAEGRHADRIIIDQAGSAGHANQAAPGAGADERADATRRGLASIQVRLRRRCSLAKVCTSTSRAPSTVGLLLMERNTGFSARPWKAAEGSCVMSIGSPFTASR